MDRSTRDLKRLSVYCNGREAGRVEDLWFDDERWMTTHLVLRTGSWPASRQLIISPEAVREVDWQARRIQLWASCEEMRNDPSFESARTAKKGAGTTGSRSATEVIGYRVQAQDGEIGHVADLVISDRDWAVDAMVVDTSNWPGGENLVVSPYRISRFSWTERKAYIDMDREDILRSPEFHYAGSRR
ncbi:MAG: PRC-barrel domain-containing protein [Acidobacteriota bacterium]